MPTIHLIRHGKTIANEKRLYCGSTDLPLSREGEDEIEQLKRKGIYTGCPELFFVSGLKRASQTLMLIYGSDTYICCPEMNEYDFGSFEMKTYEELKEHEDYIRWITDTTGDICCPGGECRNGFEKRVLAGFDRIKENVSHAKVQEAVVVCHGGVIVTVMQRLFVCDKSFYEWQPAAGRGYSVSFDDYGNTSYKCI